VLQSLMQNTSARVGGALIGFLVFLAFFAGLVAPYDPIEIDRARAALPPSLEHPFGTDRFGRDLLSRVMHGAKHSLQLGVIAVTIAVGVGGLMGLLAGFHGGWIDQFISRLLDILLAFPSVLLALIVVYVLGPGLFNLMIAVGVAAMPRYARVARGSTLSVREMTYVESARAIGAPSIRILLRHITPNILAPIIVLATLGLASAILAGAGLSFLGFGASPPTPEWGSMLSEGRDFMHRAWWLSTFPGVAIMITVLAFNLFGDGLRDALDPRHQTR
jgi:peptide/nickel transport system permease protein